jgi:hypothetical protein
MQLTSTHVCIRETAAGALAVLLVEGHLAASSAGGVRLLVLALTERRCTRTLQIESNNEAYVVDRAHAMIKQYGS